MPVRGDEPRRKRRDRVAANKGFPEAINCLDGDHFENPEFDPYTAFAVNRANLALLHSHVRRALPNIAIGSAPII